MSSKSRQSPDLAAATRRFRDGGWTYRTAARELGVSHNHLFETLRGTRDSRRLLSAVLALPPRTKNPVLKPR